MAIRVAHYGLGPIGVAVLRQVATRKGFKVVGGIDIDPGKVGRDVGDVAGLNRRLGVRVVNDAAAAIRKAKPDVVMLCTRSALRAVMPQIDGAIPASSGRVPPLALKRIAARPACSS